MISIIIPILKDPENIFLLIETLKNQTCKNFEVIFVCSLTSTTFQKKIVNQTKNINYSIYTKPPMGVYDAYNTGIDVAKGDYLYFIGDDDFFVDETLFAKVKNILKKDKPKLISFKVIHGEKKLFKSFLNLKTLLFNTLHHQGCFYHKSIFNNFRYNTDLLALSDYELNLKLYLIGTKTFSLNTIGTKVSKKGLSNQLSLSCMVNEFNVSRKRAFKDRIIDLSIILNFLFYLYSYFRFTIFKLLKVI